MVTKYISMPQILLYLPKKKKKKKNQVVAVLCPWSSKPELKLQILAKKSTCISTFKIKHNGILLTIKMNEIMPIVATWMGLEIIRLSEVSQADKRQILCAITYT